MFLHQALPKTAQSNRKPVYEIRKRTNSKNRQNNPSYQNSEEKQKPEQSSPL